MTERKRIPRPGDAELLARIDDVLSDGGVQHPMEAEPERVDDSIEETAWADHLGAEGPDWLEIVADAWELLCTGRPLPEVDEFTTMTQLARWAGVERDVVVSAIEIVQCGCPDCSARQGREVYSVLLSSVDGSLSVVRGVAMPPVFAWIIEDRDGLFRITGGVQGPSEPLGDGAVAEMRRRATELMVQRPMTAGEWAAMVFINEPGVFSYPVDMPGQGSVQ